MRPFHKINAESRLLPFADGAEREHRDQSMAIEEHRETAQVQRMRDVEHGPGHSVIDLNDDNPAHEVSAPTAKAAGNLKYKQMYRVAPGATVWVWCARYNDWDKVTPQTTSVGTEEQNGMNIDREDYTDESLPHKVSVRMDRPFKVRIVDPALPLPEKKKPVPQEKRERQPLKRTENQDPPPRREGEGVGAGDKRAQSGQQLARGEGTGAEVEGEGKGAPREKSPSLPEEFFNNDTLTIEVVNPHHAGGKEAWDAGKNYRFHRTGKVCTLADIRDRVEKADAVAKRTGKKLTIDVWLYGVDSPDASVSTVRVLTNYLEQVVRNSNGRFKTGLTRYPNDSIPSRNDQTPKAKK